MYFKNLKHTMKTILLILNLFICLYYSAAETWSLNGTHSQYPGMCFYEGEAYAPGEHKIQKRCVKIICGVNGWISGHSCVSQKLDGCKPGELSGIRRPFPDCCKRLYHCHNELKGDFVIEDF